MNAHQRRVARRKNDFRTFDLGGVQVRIYGPKSEAYRAASRRIEVLRARYAAVGPAPRGVFLSVGSNDWRQS